MPVQTQLASIAAWNDEAHVLENRDLYREKFDAVLQVLAPVMDVQKPDGGFYLWPKVPGDDAQFCRDLFEQQHVTVVPGSYLSREVEGFNPGPDACAWRWWPRLPNVSRRPSASAHSSKAEPVRLVGRPIDK